MAITVEKYSLIFQLLWPQEFIWEGGAAVPFLAHLCALCTRPSQPLSHLLTLEMSLEMSPEMSLLSLEMSLLLLPWQSGWLATKPLQDCLQSKSHKVA